MDEGMGFATMSLSPRWGAGGFAADNSGVYPSGQRGQTVNLLAYAFRGSNPLTPTSLSDLLRQTCFDGLVPSFDWAIPPALAFSRFLICSENASVSWREHHGLRLRCPLRPFRVMPSGSCHPSHAINV